jgi:hypothetical protein
MNTDETRIKKEARSESQGTTRPSLALRASFLIRVSSVFIRG